MSGILRNLARQLVGPRGPDVHARARLPFASPPAWRKDEEPDVPAPAPDPAAAPTAYAEAVDGSSPPGTAAVSGKKASREAAAASPPFELVVPVGDISTRTASQPRRRRPWQAPAVVRDDQPSAERRAALARASDDTIAAPGARAGRVQPPASGRTRTGSPRDSGHDATPAGRTAAPAPRWPEPLVATADTRPAPGPRGSRTARSSLRPVPPTVTAAAGAPGPPEVHVHIGRIEIDVAREAPPPGRQKTARKPKSLDEYLAERGNEAR